MPSAPPIILIAEDVVVDQHTIHRLFNTMNLSNEVESVIDGIELFDRLYGCEQYDGRLLPGLIILDLNMPTKNGAEVLKKLSANERFQSIPVVICTTSRSKGDIAESFIDGAVSSVTKPILPIGWEKLSGDYLFGTCT